MPPMVTPSISTVNRLCWLKSPAVFLVVPLRTSRLNFTAIQLLLSVPPRGPCTAIRRRSIPLPGFPFTLSGPLPDRRPPLPDLIRAPGAANEPAPGAQPPPLLRLPGHLANAEDDEFRRLHRSDADLADHLARVDHLRRVGLRIALHVERLFRRLAHQRARVVDAQEECGDVAGHALP